MKTPQFKVGDMVVCTVSYHPYAKINSIVTLLDFRGGVSWMFESSADRVRVIIYEEDFRKVTKLELSMK